MRGRPRKRWTDTQAAKGSIVAVGYERVSTAEQVEGTSLDVQQQAIRDYCAAQDWVLAASYVDAGNDLLRGGDGADIMDGGDGDDETLSGGAETDMCDGADGKADTADATCEQTDDIP